MPPSEQARHARRFNINQTFRVVAALAMSVWTPWRVVGVYAPASWPQSAREAVTIPAIVLLAVWLVLGFQWRRRPDRWGSES